MPSRRMKAPTAGCALCRFSRHRARQLFHADVACLIRHALLPGAPAGIHAEGAALQDRLDAVNLAALNLEELPEFPGPRLHRAGHDVPAVRGLEVPGVAALMIEERKGEDNAALFVNRHI